MVCTDFTANQLTNADITLVLIDYVESLHTMGILYLIECSFSSVIDVNITF